MESSSSFDVAVVGGSIAGSTAATMFARKGLKVALIEARANPDAYKALCTHFIQPSATPTIQRLGVAEKLEEAGAVRNSLEMWNRWGWIRRPEGDAAYGYSLRREALDPILRATAAETPGVTYLPGRTATGLVRDGSRVIGVEVRDPDGNVSSISAALVVAADGRHSRLAELAGVGAKKLPNKRSGYFAYYEGIPNPRNAARTWFLDPDVAYVFPNEDGISILACMFGRKEKLDWFRKDLAGNIRRTFERLPDGPDLSNAKQVSKVIGAVDLPNFWRNSPPEGLAFTGDAMVASDPLFGVGCGWAFQEAEWLVECTAGHLGSREELKDAVTAYRRRVRRELLAHYLMVNEYSLNRRYNPAEKLLFSAGAKDAKLANVIHDFGGRVIPVSKLVSPVTMGRAAIVNLRSRSDKELTARNRIQASRVMSPPDEPGLRRRTIEVAGIESPVIESGPDGAREAVVFVHGNPGSSEDYSGLVAEAGKLGRAVAMDMPGFGKAGKPAGFDYTVEGYAAHLGKMLDQLGIDRAHLVAHDFGGPWALAWAAANPEAYASATLIDTGVLLGYRWHYLAKIWQTPVVGELFTAMSTAPAFRLLLRHGNSGGLPRPFLDRMYEDFDRGTKRAVLKLYRATRDVNTPSQQLRAVLGKIERPVLVIWGKKDPYLGYQFAEGQKVTFPNARVVVLEKSGHWPFVDNPEAVKDALIPFLSEAMKESFPVARS